MTNHWKSLAVALATIVLAVVCVMSREHANTIYLKTSIYFLLVFFGLLLWSWYGFVAAIEPGWKQQWRRWLPWVGAGIGVAALVFLAVPPDLRIVSDETNLLGMGRGLYLKRVPTIPTQGVFMHGKFHAWFWTDPDRPLLFPGLLFLFNLLFGYHLENGFVANFLILAATMGLTAVVAARAGGWRAALVAVGLFVAQPLFPTYAASSGYELMNIALLGTSAFFLLRYLERRDSPSLTALWLTLLAAAHTRHESALFFLLTLGGLVSLRALPWALVKERLALYLSTGLLIYPRVIHQWIYGKAQTAVHQVNREDIASFSFAFFEEHGRDLLSSTFNLDFYYPYAPLLAAGGFAACLYLAYRWRRDPVRRTWLIISTAAVGAQTVVSLAFWAGVPSSQINARYFLPLSMFQSALVAITVTKILQEARARQLRFAALAFVAIAFTLYFPVASGRSWVLYPYWIRKVLWVHQNLAPKPDSVVVAVVDMPGRYAAANIGAISSDYLKDHLEELKGRLERRELTSLVVIDELDQKTLKPRKTLLPNDRRLVTKPYASLNIGNDTIVQLSSLSFLEEKPAAAPEAAPKPAR